MPARGHVGVFNRSHYEEVLVVRGREIVLGLRGAGDVIGDLSTLDGAPRSATALALGEVEATVALRP